LLYIDDDARPGPGWLAHLAWTLARPGVVNAGGPISPLWLGPRPPGWPGRENEALLGVLDLGDAERSLMAPDVVYGGNWAVRRAALHAVGGFDPRFGVRPDARIGGEEVSVAWRLHEHGLGATIYAPGAAVGHLTPADRIDDLFLLRRSACVGIERPLHEQALGRADRDRLLASAAAAGRHLMELVPIRGTATVASALDELARADAPLSDRVRAANALGELAASVALLGEDQVLFGDMSLQIEREPLLRGIVTGPVPSIRT
jgi:hypothetical protein